MVLVVIGLGALVFYLARKAPANANTAGTVIGPNPLISAVGANNVQSPATANGSPQISQANQLRLNTTYQNAVTAPGKVVSSQVPNRVWRKRRKALNSSADYLTDADNSLMTQSIPAIVSQTNNLSTVGVKV